MSMEEEQAMTTIVIFVIAGLIFAWGWYRIYRHNIQKGTRPLIAHMLGFYWEFSRPSFSFMPVSPVTLRLNLNRHPQ